MGVRDGKKHLEGEQMNIHPANHLLQLLDRIIAELRHMYPNFNSIPAIDKLNSELIDSRNKLTEHIDDLCVELAPGEWR